MHKTAIKVVLSVAAIVFASAVSLAQGESAAPAEEQELNPFNAVVKLEVSTAKADVIYPWISVPGTLFASGVVIGDGRILTSAQCVADAVNVRVRKENVDVLYQGTVLFVDHDTDLALVGVGDGEFMTGVTPLKVGATPYLRDEVMAAGYSIGDDRLTCTRKGVTRIEDTSYAQTFLMKLAIQMDFDIDPGYRGGPILDMETSTVVGILTQAASAQDSDPLRYAISPDVIRHFLEDIKDGKVDGPGYTFGGDISCTPLGGACARKYYRMTAGQTGVVIDHVSPLFENASVKAGDVLLEVDGYKVSNSGMIRLADGEPRSFYFLFYTRQVGETIPVKLLREGKVVETSVTLSPRRDLRFRGFLHGLEADYLVFGGLVFTTLSADFLTTENPRFYDRIIDRRFPDDEAVVISAVLADKSVEGYFGFHAALLRTVNGVEVRNLRHLAELLDSCDDGFVRFGFDNCSAWDETLIVDAKEMREATARVMKRNQIPADRSADLRAK